MVTHAGLLQLRLWQSGVLAFAALVGLVAGLSPQLGLAAALGAAFVALVLSDLALGLGLFLVVAFMEGIGSLGSFSLAKAVGALLVASWLASRLNERENPRELTRDHPAVVGVAVLLGGWVVMSAVWAELPGAALGSAMRWIPNLALFAIVYAGIRSPGHVRWMFALFIGGAFLSTLAGVVLGGADPKDGSRLAGSGLNANELGTMLAAGAVLAGALAASRDLSGPARALALASGGASIVLVMMTASRGAVLGLVAALLVAPFVVGRGRRVAVTLMALAAIGCGTVYLFAFAGQETVAHLLSDDRTGSGRTDIWKVGWRMVEDKPLIGVGAENFGSSTIHYLLEPGTLPRSEFIVDEQKVAHNVYLQVQAELGAVGLTLYLLLIAFAFHSAMVAAGAFARAGQQSAEILTRGLVIALAAIHVAAIFGSTLYSKQVWLLMALCLALRAMAPRPTPRTG